MFLSHVLIYTNEKVTVIRFSVDWLKIEFINKIVQAYNIFGTVLLKNEASFLEKNQTILIRKENKTTLQKKVRVRTSESVRRFKHYRDPVESDAPPQP